MKRALGAALALGLACPGVAGDLALSIAIGDLEFPGGIRLHDIRLACPRITVDAGGVACTDGEFTAARSPLGTLRVPVRAMRERLGASSRGVLASAASPAEALALLLVSPEFMTR